MRAARRVVAVVSLVIAAVGLYGGPTGAEEAKFAAGSGRAAAKLVKVGPSRGALTLAPQVGLAMSDFLNTRGRGDVRFADLAALETSLPPEVVKQVPTVKVESTDENSEAGKTTSVSTPPEVPLKVSAAELHADAGKAPYGASSFTAGSIGLGVGTITGGRASSRSGVVKDGVREAVAEVVVPRLELADGAVVLESLKWRVVDRSGSEQAQEASFTVGGATIAGKPLSSGTESGVPLGQLADALAPALDPLGLELTFPKMSSDAGVITMGPLRLRMRASKLAPALVPLTDAVQPVRDSLVGPVRDASGDQVDAAILLSDVALGVLEGGSALDIDVGGVTASTAEPGAAFRLGGTGGFDLGSSKPVSAVGAGAGSGLGASSTPASGSGGTGTTTPTVGAASPQREQQADADLRAMPVSASKSRGGALLGVGLVGLAAAALAAGADLRKVRSRQREIVF